MGILDNKRRIMDVVLTNEGRRQLASGELKIRFATFSDASSCYDADVVSGSANAGDRIYLEAASLPQDNIVPEADDSGALMPFGTHGEYLLQSGQLFKNTLSLATGSTISGSSKNLEAVSGTQFASLIEGILTGSIDNFDRLRTIASWDPDVEEQGFSIGPSSVEFPLLSTGPIADSRFFARSVNSMESIFNDPRFSQVSNFQYLPPINRIPDKNVDRGVESNVKSHRIANYVPWGTVINKTDSYKALMLELKSYEDTGFCRRFSIDPTSRENNLMCQFFEIGDSSAKKLDTVHFGRFNTRDRASPVIDVFFAGRIFIDDNGSQTFLHLFTLVFE